MNEYILIFFKQLLNPLLKILHFPWKNIPVNLPTNPANSNTKPSLWVRTERVVKKPEPLVISAFSHPTDSPCESPTTLRIISTNWF